MMFAPESLSIMRVNFRQTKAEGSKILFERLSFGGYKKVKGKATRETLPLSLQHFEEGMGKRQHAAART